MSYTRKSFSGNAVATTLTANIASTDTTIAVVGTSGFPNTSNGPFVVVIDRGTTNEEKILISSYTATLLTVSQRGWDGTTPVPHSTGAVLAHTFDADTINKHETFVAGNGTVTPSASAVGDTGTDGTSSLPAAADHKHAREPWATGATTTSAFGDSANDGTSLSPARADHKHGRESSPLGLPLGLTGATAATRYGGGTASGAPTTGTWAQGDIDIDQTGTLWICITAGTPGTWVTPFPVGNPAGRMKNTAATSISNNATAQITGMAQDFVKGGVTYGTNSLTVPVAGKYLIVANIGSTNWTSDAVVTSGQVFVEVEKNGTVIGRSETVASSNYPSVTWSDIVTLAANDVLTLLCGHSTGQTLFADPGNGNSLPSTLAVSLESQ